MKSYFLVSVLYLALSMLSCQDSKDSVKIVEHDLDFYRSVGEEIPTETAIRWREFYESQNSAQGRLALSGFNLSPAEVDTLIESVNDIVGVAFHYAIDGNGATHIIAIPIDESLSLWSNIPGRVYIDTNTGNSISGSIASTWAESYKNANPYNIWFHFFGESTFDEITSIPNFDTIEILPAINILNLTPQLLLTVWADLPDGGRTKQKASTTYDASSPCPPCGIN